MPFAARRCESNERYLLGPAGLPPPFTAIPPFSSTTGYRRKDLGVSGTALTMRFPAALVKRDPSSLTWRISRRAW